MLFLHIKSLFWSKNCKLLTPYTAAFLLSFILFILTDSLFPMASTLVSPFGMCREPRVCLDCLALLEMREAMVATDRLGLKASKVCCVLIAY